MGMTAFGISRSAVRRCLVFVFLIMALGGSVALSGVLTVWSLLVENAVILLPRGDVLTQYMPFLNGVYGSGQDLALDPPWGRGGALLYLCLVALVLIVAGWLRTRAARRR